MCVNPDLLPLEKIENGKHIGINGDYIQHLSTIIGIPITLVPTQSWQQTLKFAQERTCDIVSSIIDTPTRREYLFFTTNPLEYSVAIATMIDKSFVDTIDSIANQKVAIIKEYAFGEILKTRFPNISLVEVNTIEEGFELVRKGRVFGYIDLFPILSYSISHNYFESLKINGKFDEKWKLSIGVRNDDPILLSIFNKAVNAVDEHVKTEIYNRWVSSVRHEQKPDYTLIIEIIIFFVAFLIFYINRYLVVAKYNKKLHEAIENFEKLVAVQVEEIERKNQLIQEQNKLISMGEMIGAIAHQWRQPLNALNINIQNLEDDYQEGIIDQSFIDDFIKRNRKTIEFMSKTIDDFRNFFRIDKAKQDFSLLETIHETLSLQDAQLKHNHIKVSIQGEDFIVHGFKSEFQQVLLNLITNAKDAILENKILNGEIFITLFDTCVSVEDNGGGIEESILQRIFEPYFTTKDQGKGTGLGLYIAKMIVEQNMDGALHVSAGKMGAKFSIHFKI